MFDILISFLSCFLGYAFGRIGHILGGHYNGPHHWIYGLILLIAGLFFRECFWGIPLFYFGAGVFVSDLKDFLEFKFWGIDDVKVKRFWDID